MFILLLSMKEEKALVYLIKFHFYKFLDGKKRGNIFVTSFCEQRISVENQEFHVTILNGLKNYV